MGQGFLGAVVRIDERGSVPREQHPGGGDAVDAGELGSEEGVLGRRRVERGFGVHADDAEGADRRGPPAGVFAGARRGEERRGGDAALAAAVPSLGSRGRA